MSVSNVFVGSDRILCLTDTMIYRGNMPVGLCERKCFVSESGRFAFSMRGTHALLQVLGPVLARVESIEHVDIVIRGVPERIGDEFFEASGGEITLMCWSANKQAPQSTRYKLRAGGVPVQATTMEPGIHLAPRMAPGVRLPAHADEAMMVKMALGQHKVQEKFSQPMCIGGVMHLTEVNEHGADQKIAGFYPDYSEYYDRFGCPHAAEYRSRTATASSFG
ncbi:MAG TPA: hypothetical protein VD995_03285 [Azospirillum sp.]|nr:hypothetical protein [Azospirillum sp.]